MNLVEISPDLKIIAGKCYVSRLVRVFSGFGEKIRDQTDHIGFRKKRYAIDCQSSRVGQWSVRFRSDLPGGSSLRLSWTPLDTRYVAQTPGINHRFHKLHYQRLSDGIGPF